MKFQILISLSSLLIVLSSVSSVFGGKGSNNRQQSVPIQVPASGSSATTGYSQPIPASYAAPIQGAVRQEMYQYSQPIVAGSTQADYYQPAEPAYGYGQAYGRHHQQPAAAAQAAYYEPVPQGSGGHHHALKRGHGYGWHPHSELSTILFIAIPLILIPLLLCWPYFLYAASHHHHPVVYAAGWKRSSDGKIPTAQEAKAKKTDELTEKIVSKLDS